MAIDANSKFDTVFLSRSAGSGLADDLSQYHGDLTDEGGGIFTSTDSRFDLSSPREISVVIDASLADDGFLCAYTDEGWNDGGYMIRISGGLAIFFIGTSDIATLGLPSVGAFDTSYLIHWSTTYDTVSASYLSEMMVLNLNTGSSTIARAYHSAPPTDPSWKFCVTGFWWDGSGIYTNTITSVRLGARFHSTVEAREEWYLASSAPTITGFSPPVRVHPEMEDPFIFNTSEALGLAVAQTSAFAGPALYWGALSAGEGRLRLYSPLVNESTPNGMTLSSSVSASAWHRDAPSADSYRMPLGYLFGRPVPSACDAVKVRLHVQCWITAGAPMGTAMDFRFKLIAMSKLPSMPGLLSWQQTTNAIVTTNHGSSGVGEWIDLGLCSLPVDPGQICFFAVAYWVPAGTGSGSRSAKIKHVSLEPVKTH